MNAADNRTDTWALRTRPRRAGAMLAAALLWFSSVAAAEDVELNHRLRERVVHVPMQVETAAGPEQLLLTATTYQPPGEGPFPLVVLSHGSPGDGAARATMGRYRHLTQIGEFVQRGFAVIAPMRRGYGATGGRWAERYGACAAPDYYRAGLEAQKDLLATIAFASKLPFVDPDRIVLVGQSAGGIASIAAASANPRGVVGVVNFSGGRGGRPHTNPGEPCVPENMSAAIGKFAATIRVPVLWHYAENDQYFAPHHVRAWFKAFEDAGARGKLVMQPPFGWDGHGLFAARGGLAIWTAEFDRFMEGVPFSSKGR